jgi:hypothetical protein
VEPWSALILSMDDMRWYWQATLARVWYPKGHRPTVLVSRQPDGLHWYGALALHSSQAVALNLPTLDSQATLHRLNHWLTVFPVQPILLFLDRAAWHRGATIRAFLTENLRLPLLYFPPACPQLNPHKHTSGKPLIRRSAPLTPI